MKGATDIPTSQNGNIFWVFGIIKGIINFCEC